MHTACAAVNLTPEYKVWIRYAMHRFAYLTYFQLRIYTDTLLLLFRVNYQ